MYTPIIGTLGFILSEDGKRTLLVHRNARNEDHHLGKYNGLGGKMLPGEDVVTCLKREVKEEAGLDCLDIVLRGTVNWPGFGPDGQDWLGFIFLIRHFAGVPFASNDEGTLSWHLINLLDRLPMWEGDKYFIPLVFDDDERVFHGVMPYEDGHPLSWNSIRI